MPESNAEKAHVAGCLAEYPLGCHGVGCKCPCHLLNAYDPSLSLIARGVMADPDEHDPDSCEYACCVVNSPAQTTP